MMNVNKKKTYDSSDSSSDSDSDNEELSPQTVNGSYPSLSLVDDGQTVLHIPNYEGREADYDEEPGESDDVKKTTASVFSKEKSVKKIDAVLSDTDKQKRTVKRKKKKLLYICLANCKYESVRRAARRFGFKEVGEEEDWNLYWTDFSVSLERVMDMKRYQKINHFPGMSELCRKDLLARNLNRMLKLFPKDYNFFPRSWCLPADFGDFLAYTRQKKNKTYILKPESGCQGKGIWLTKSPKDIKPHEHMLCQQYLSKPFLIDGFKFDLRVYVVVTACDPLRIFVFQEGLGRFATCKYIPPSSSNVHNVYMHLTNYAINKNSNDFNRDDEAGSKRRITTINRWLADNGFDVDKAWRDVDDIVIKTLISAHTVLKHNYRTCFPNHIRGSACFEVLGFDIVFDKKLHPLVLEVNHSPSFTTDAPIDREIKDILLYDTLNLVNFGATDRRRCIEEDRRKVKERLFTKQDKKELKEDQDRATLKWLEEQTAYEDLHLGNFRRIYPAEGTEKYDKFFHSSGSLYQETAAFKARSECARQQREEISKKQEKLESMLRKKKDGTASGILRPESPQGAGSKPRKRNGDGSSVLALKSHGRSTASTDDDDGMSVANERVLSARRSCPDISHSNKNARATSDSLRPTEIQDADESERITLLMQRDSLVRGLGIVEHCHRLLKSVQALGNGSEPVTVAAVVPGRSQATISVGTGDRPNGLTVDTMALSNAVADAHYYLAAMNSRYTTLTAQQNVATGGPTEVASHHLRQQQQHSPTVPSQRNGLLQGQGQGRAETVSWRSTASHLGGTAQPLASNDRSNGSHRTRYTNRNNSLGGSDSNALSFNENGRGPASMKMMLNSAPPVQYDGISGSTTSGVVSGHPSYQPMVSTINILLPHIKSHQHSQQPTPYFGLSVISAPAPFAQRSTVPSGTATDQPSSSSIVSGNSACRVGSGGGGFRGHHRPIPLKTAARDS